MEAYKTRLEPNNKQRTFFKRCAGTARYTFNWGLTEWKRQYEAAEKPSRFKLCKQFNAAKDDFCPWVREMPYAITESAFLNLGLAFHNFFRRVKQGQEPGYPKFKSRYSRKSFQMRYFKVKSDRVRLTGIGWVRLSEKDYIPIGAKYGTYATISERAGHWFISVLVKDEVEPGFADNDQIIGVDFGIKELAVCSNGKVFENPKPLRKAQRKLKRLGRELSRRKEGGMNWRKTKVKVQKAHYQVACLREYTQHRVSDYLVYDLHPSVIVLEDLNVRGMVKNHGLAQAINDVGFSELRHQIEYKAEREGIKVVIADRWFPSSKTCSRCGCVKSDLTLANRIFTCLDCSFTIDRDLNAALNLAAYGRKGQAGPDCLGS